MAEQPSSNDCIGPDGFTLDGIIANAERSGFIAAAEVDATVRALRELRGRRTHETRRTLQPTDDYVLVSDMTEIWTPTYGKGLFATQDAVKSPASAEKASDDLVAAKNAANAALTCGGACRYDGPGLFYRDPGCSTHGLQEKAAVFRCPATNVDCVRNCSPGLCAIAKTY